MILFDLHREKGKRTEDYLLQVSGEVVCCAKDSVTSGFKGEIEREAQ